MIAEDVKKKFEKEAELMYPYPDCSPRLVEHEMGKLDANFKRKTAKENMIFGYNSRNEEIEKLNLRIRFLEKTLKGNLDNIKDNKDLF